MQRIRIHSLVAFIVLAVGALVNPVVAQPVEPAAAAGSLPAVNLPSVAAPNPNGPAVPLQPTSTNQANEVSPQPGAPEQSAATDATVASPAIPAPPRVYSFGDSTLSILFLPDQVNKMKDALRTFEDSGLDAAAPAPVVATQQAMPAPEVIEDPVIYPVFYLSSIVYDDPKDWSLWISGYKITSRKNDTDVTVLSVTPDSATFVWTPSFSKALAKRTSDKLFAPADLVKSRFTPVQRASFDASTGATVFTLKPNQTFAVGYFKIFEGYMDGPQLTPLPVQAPTPQDVAPPVDNVNNDGQLNPNEEPEFIN